MENIVLVVSSLTVKCARDTLPSEIGLFLYIYRHFYFIWFFHIAGTLLYFSLLAFFYGIPSQHLYFFISLL